MKYYLIWYENPLLPNDLGWVNVATGLTAHITEARKLDINKAHYYCTIYNQALPGHSVQEVEDAQL